MSAGQRTRAPVATRRAAPAPRRRSSAAARRRDVARRRRRSAQLACAVAVVAVAALLIRPLFERAINALTLPLQYQSIIRREAAAERLDPALIAAVIYSETRFDARTSPAGAEGLMQLEPSTALFLAHRSGGTGFTVADLWQPDVNIAYGSYYLRYLLNEYHGSVWLALAAYNAGETNVDDWLTTARAEHRSLTIASIPFPATRDYVQDTLAKQRDYRLTYPHQLGYS